MRRLLALGTVILVAAPCGRLVAAGQDVPYAKRLELAKALGARPRSVALAD